MSSWREIDFALNCTYIVPDQVSDPTFSLPKAMTSIPRNLTFEYGADNEVRIRPGEEVFLFCPTLNPLSFMPKSY